MAMLPEHIFVLALVGVAVPAVLALINTMLTVAGNNSAAQLHRHINSRMDEMIELVRTQAHSAGREEAFAESAGKIEAAVAQNRIEGREDRAEGRAESPTSVESAVWWRQQRA